MSGNSSGTKHPHSRIDTLIGAGMRVDGHMTFAGVLRMEGEALGDLLCDADSNGMIVVGKSGSVAGTINAPHIVVGGRVTGPMHSSESVEIQSGGSVAGDVSYKQIEIHSGGVVDGTLTATAVADGAHPAPGKSSPSMDFDVMTGGVTGAHQGRGRIIGVAAALIMVAATALWLSRSPAPVAPAVGPSAGDPIARAEPPVGAAPTAPSAAAASGGLPESSKGASGDAAPVAPDPAPAAGSAAQASQPDLRPVADPEMFVVVQGVNPGKPAGIVLVIGKEPSVLFRKKRQEPGEGKRIELAPGASVSIPIARGEVLRVAEGREIALFYQGRKVSPRDIESGVWMGFVPQSSVAVADDK